jgi:hypothetical protein
MQAPCQAVGFEIAISVRRIDRRALLARQLARDLASSSLDGAVTGLRLIAATIAFVTLTLLVRDTAAPTTGTSSDPERLTYACGMVR